MSIWTEFSEKMFNAGAMKARGMAMYQCLASKGMAAATGKGMIGRTIRGGAGFGARGMSGMFGGAAMRDASFSMRGGSAMGLWNRGSVLRSMGINAGIGAGVGAATAGPGNRVRGGFRGAMYGAGTGLAARGMYGAARSYARSAPQFGSAFNKGLAGYGRAYGKLSGMGRSR